MDTLYALTEGPTGRIRSGRDEDARLRLISVSYLSPTDEDNDPFVDGKHNAPAHLSEESS